MKKLLSRSTLKHWRIIENPLISQLSIAGLYSSLLKPGVDGIIGSLEGESLERESF